jgi:hypothetical protein
MQSVRERLLSILDARLVSTRALIRDIDVLCAHLERRGIVRPGIYAATPWNEVDTRRVVLEWNLQFYAIDLVFHSDGRVEGSSTRLHDVSSGPAFEHRVNDPDWFGCIARWVLDVMKME